MESPRSTPSPKPVLPPIISNERDHQFLRNLTTHIEIELKKIDRNNPEQRYIIHKDAFDKIIEYVSAYKPLLTAIKAEYEDCIDTILRGQREAFYLAGKLKAIATEPSTIHNYRKRADDLESKLKIIAKDNEKLKLQVARARERRMEIERQPTETEEPPPQEKPKDINRPIPGLSLEQSTDKTVLTKEFEKWERQLKELNISYKTRFSPKDIRDALKDHLSHKVTLRDHLQEQTAILKEKSIKLKVGVEAAQAYARIQPPHQSIGEAVVNALARVDSQSFDRGFGEEADLTKTTSSNSFEDNDPTREREAEHLLEYIEKFNELVEDKKYEEAAIHAANSPKGILRTPETMQRFKDLQGELTSSGRSTLLAFCDALMSSVPAYPDKPSALLSLTCVQCALDENKLDLITHWLSQNRLTLTKEIGDRIYNFSEERDHVTTQSLIQAQKVYTDIQADIPAMQCMVKQGRIGQAMEYAHKVQLSCEECAVVLASDPSQELAQRLYEAKLASKRLMPMGQVAYTLITHDASQLGVQFIRYVHQHGDERGEPHPSRLRNAVFEDELTTEEQWHTIVESCQENGYHDSSIDILAAVTVIMSVRKAALYVEEMERQRLEEERKAKQLKEASVKKREKKKKRKRHVNKDDAAGNKVVMESEGEHEISPRKVDREETVKFIIE